MIEAQLKLIKGTQLAHFCFFLKNGVTQAISLSHRFQHDTPETRHLSPRLLKIRRGRLLLISGEVVAYHLAPSLSPPSISLSPSELESTTHPIRALALSPPSEHAAATLIFRRGRHSICPLLFLFLFSFNSSIRLAPFLQKLSPSSSPTIVVAAVVSLRRRRFPFSSFIWNLPPPLKNRRGRLKLSCLSLFSGVVSAQPPAGTLSPIINRRCQFDVQYLLRPLVYLGLRRVAGTSPPSHSPWSG